MALPLFWGVNNRPQPVVMIETAMSRTWDGGLWPLSTIQAAGKTRRGEIVQYIRGRIECGVRELYDDAGEGVLGGEKLFFFHDSAKSETQCNTEKWVSWVYTQI